MRENVSAPITSARLKVPARSSASAVASAKTKPEHTACTSNAAPCVMPSPACTDTALAGNVLSGVAVASTIRSIDGASMRGVKRGARRVDGELGRGLARRRDVALADAGALDDPLVGGVDHLGQLGIGEDVLGQIAADAEHDRTGDAHDAAPATRGGAGGGPCMRLILSMSWYFTMS